MTNEKVFHIQGLQLLKNYNTDIFENHCWETEGETERLICSKVYFLDLHKIHLSIFLSFI
jgi:hypothetical protein